jgi:hypothetical protein
MLYVGLSGVCFHPFLMPLEGGIVRAGVRQGQLPPAPLCLRFNARGLSMEQAAPISQQS